MEKAQKFTNILQIMLGGQLVAGGLATWLGDETWYKKFLMPAIQTVCDGETSHWLAVKAAQYGFMPRVVKKDTPCLRTQLWGISFANPLGLAAGFDKHGECVDGMSKIGFGFVEVGSVTPLPQPGNEKPRVFRLKEDKAVINRYGFNSDGHEVVHQRLVDRLSNKKEGAIVGVNLGKNKESTDPVNDYVLGVKKFADVANYLVINISSPNTPGLRDMQGRQQLQNLLEQVIKARNSLPKEQQRPLLVKIAPDLTEKDRQDIAAVITETGVDGLIITNTTISRPDSLTSNNKAEAGGLSGAPLKEMSTMTVREMYKLTKGTVPIIGVGGVANAEDAYEKIKAGASLVQIYTALSYAGPPLINVINKDLAKLLKADGYERISEAVGVDHVRGERKSKS